MQRDSECVDLTLSRGHLKRSNALRIKSNNLELLPYSLKESLLLLRGHLQERQDANQNYDHHHDDDDDDDDDDDPGAAEEEQLSLLEQIKRGVKLRPVGARERRAAKSKLNRQAQAEETLSSLLVQVLRRRYEAIQLTDEESDASSIASNESASPDQQQLFASIQYDDKATQRGQNERMRRLSIKLSASSRAARTLLEQFTQLDANKQELSNDLTIKL